MSMQPSTRKTVLARALLHRTQPSLERAPVPVIPTGATITACTAVVDRRGSGHMTRTADGARDLFRRGEV